MMQRTFSTQETVDFVVVGSGAAGGVMAKELSTSGFKVVVLEQGPFRKSSDFTHDELGHWIFGTLQSSPINFPQTFRATEAEEARTASQPPPIIYARGVGGSSVHFTANYWRLHPVESLRWE